MTRSAALTDHIATAILNAATGVLAERGESASMADVAAAAGIGRTTLYRYFPNREALLRSLATTAVAELGEQIAEARLDTVDTREGLIRITRAALSAATKYRAVARTPKDPVAGVQAERALGEPLRALLRRGHQDGTLRDDIPVETMSLVYSSLIFGAVAHTLGEKLGVEQATSVVVTVFLSGVLKDPSAER
ncbi:TetR/AcrR family transcriptional regulator [Streptomyces litchfieldiae]|uniref:TetR/AcrR family transcriptional regulator n=1 Tax=Streptomyces litchfieldiae TaxID=3075543 RepID=A0ABU2MLZ8_9ACTN|nr:TetR/AcrR family transcriptional regulator [Streptomyces sp. DSM 44938]MDT0342635.1 TetR/AcrR family transcriptional regulator [Streptomyces sp. DSM 44938]